MLVENPQKNDKEVKHIELTKPYMELATRWQRFCAMIVNNFIMLIVIVLVFSLDLILSSTRIFLDTNRSIANIIFFILVISTVFLQLFFIYQYRQTVGKKLMQIRVVNYHSKQPVNFIRYFLREIFDIIGSQLGLITLINIVMIFVNKEKRTLTDFLFGTVVVKDK